MNTTVTPSIEPRFRTIDGLRIRYAESSGSDEPVVLLTSPWPESLYAFSRMWATLAAHARLFAVDLPGFGASERRDDLLSPRAMGRVSAPSSSPRQISERPTSSRPTWERPPPSSRRRHIPSGWRA